MNLVNILGLLFDLLLRFPSICFDHLERLTTYFYQNDPGFGGVSIFKSFKWSKSLRIERATRGRVAIITKLEISHPPSHPRIFWPRRYCSSDYQCHFQSYEDIAVLSSSFFFASAQVSRDSADRVKLIVVHLFVAVGWPCDGKHRHK